MPITPATIDRIVADVLAQLGESPSGGSNTRATAVSAVPSDAEVKSTPGSQNSGPSPKAFDLDLSHATVLTGDMLEKLSAGASIKVAKSLVLTPSAREVVAKQSLKLVDGAETAGKTDSSTSKLSPQLLVVTSNPETRTLADGLKKAGWVIDYPGCDGDAIKAARSAICRGETNFVAVIAPRPNRTAQRLNRTRNVLAAPVFPETSVGELQSEGDWNVACLAADRWASFRLRKTLETMAKGAAG